LAEPIVGNFVNRREVFVLLNRGGIQIFGFGRSWERSYRKEPSKHPRLRGGLDGRRRIEKTKKTITL
jgi:hypothetical protein